MTTKHSNRQSLVKFSEMVNLANGAHILYLFSDQRKYMQNLSSFIRAGLDLGQQVIIIEEKSRYTAALADLGQRGYSESDLKKVLFEDNQDFYQPDQDGNIRGIIRRFSEIVEPLLKRGVTIRAWGRVCWSDYQDSIDSLKRYELNIDEFTSRGKALTVCAYDGHQLSAKALMELMELHPYIMNDTELADSCLYRNLSKGGRLTEVKDNLAETISDLEMDKERIERLNKLEVIEETVFHISHEVRNPIGAVRSLLELMSLQCDGKDRRLFELMISEIDRANSILSEFSSLGKHQTFQFKKEDLNQIITEMTPLLKAMANTESHYIQLDLKEIPELLLDSKRIHQVILNLVKNGLDAMDSGGTVTIQTRKEGKKVVLTIKDEGPGIPREIQKKLGTPFFTTKENGTGLGLATCYKILERHEAEVEINTGSDGTVFNISFHVEGE